MKVGFNERNGSAPSLRRGIQRQTLHLAQAQTRVSVPHRLWPASAFLPFWQERCGTDTLVCAGEARQNREDHYGFDSFARNSFAFANADASPSTIARTISAIAPACGRRLSRLASMIGVQTE